MQDRTMEEQISRARKCETGKYGTGKRRTRALETHQIWKSGIHLGVILFL